MSYMFYFASEFDNGDNPEGIRGWNVRLNTSTTVMFKDTVLQSFYEEEDLIDTDGNPSVDFFNQSTSS